MRLYSTKNWIFHLNRDCYHVDTGINIDSRETAQYLKISRELDNGIKTQTNGRQPQRLTLWKKNNPLPVLCSRRSFWQQFCLDRLQQSRDRERAARGNATHASTQACLLTHTCTCTQWLSLHCTMIACPFWQWYKELTKEHLDTLAKGNYAWKCTI